MNVFKPIGDLCDYTSIHINTQQYMSLPFKKKKCSRNFAVYKKIYNFAAWKIS